MIDAPWNQDDGPCAICGNAMDYCICPECPECGGVGDPECYKHHGLVRSPEQIQSLKEFEEGNQSALKLASDWAYQELSLLRRAGQNAEALKKSTHAVGMSHDHDIALVKAALDAAAEYVRCSHRATREALALDIAALDPAPIAAGVEACFDAEGAKIVNANLRARVAELERDAARYRWLRTHDTDMARLVDHAMDEGDAEIWASDVDDYIDLAMKGGK